VPQPGLASPIHYLVLEYLEGETLASRIARGPLPLADALKIAIEIASALDKAHRQGIVHRDLKPGNVMLTRVANRETGSKLLDFGLAGFSKNGFAAAAAGNSATLPIAAPLTARGTILAPFNTCRPSKLKGASRHACGPVCIRRGALRNAHGAQGVRRQEPGGLTQRNPERRSRSRHRVAAMTPPALDRIIRTCLVKDPEDRLQTAHDLWLQLQWVAEGGSAAGPAAPVVTHRKNRERGIWLASAIALAVVASAAIWWLKPAPRSRT